MKYKNKVHRVPRPLLADAYTIGSFKFQSEEARQKSVYYITFRRELYKINETIYDKGDDRILFCGLQRIIEQLFLEPIEQWEIDETKKMLEFARISGKGLKEYSFDEEMWQDIVDNYNGTHHTTLKGKPNEVWNNKQLNKQKRIQSWQEKLQKHQTTNHHVHLK